MSAQGANATNVGTASATGNSIDLKNGDGNIVVAKSTTSNDVSFDLADNVAVNSVTAGGTVLGTTGLTIAGGPSVTTAGISAGGLAVTNVAAGVSPTDAVNVSQLTGAAGGVTTAGMNFTGNDSSAGTVHRDLGQTLAIQGAATTAGTYSGGNIKTVTDPATGAVNIQMADAPTFGGVTVNAGGTGKITGVTAGTLSAASTDAVNGSQLFATNQQVTTNTTNIATNTAAITNLDNTITNINNGGGIKYFHANSALADSQAIGTDSVAIGPQAVANNAGDVALGSGSTTLAAVGTAGTTIGGTSYSFAGTTPTSTVSVGSAGNERTITNVAAGRLDSGSTDAINGSQLFATNQQVTTNTQAVTTIGQGWTVSAQGANATNVGTASATGNSIDLKNGDGNIVVAKSTTSNDVSFDLADNVAVNSVTAGGTVLGTTGLTIAGGPSVTTAGISAGGLAVTNVAAGVSPTDAVNVSQLTGAAGGVTTAGMNFTGNDSSAGNVHRDLGQTLAIQGAATTAGTYSGGNIKTVTDPATGAVNIQMADAPTFGGVTVNAGGTGKITGVTAGIRLRCVH